MNLLLKAIFLVTLTERLSEALVAPIKKKWPNADLWWWLYVSWIIGSVVTFLSGINLFTEIVPDLSPLAGQILTAVVAGGGANLLSDAFSKIPKMSITSSSSEPGTMMATVSTPVEPRSGDN